ncbi:uncharacterized protein LOC122817011 [Protopterus annectens]|uniref:uncharacterized protein LOC122817011 n=1 Tax=Protopterus annectens TaxID=7888 RepID=UPI001CFA81B9|nr:uncharacterized protein LOC122817011 [Protopterus annectens]
MKAIEMVVFWFCEFGVLFLHGISTSLATVVASCGKSVELPCLAEKTDYRAVSWYKMSGEKNRISILRKTQNKTNFSEQFLRLVNINDKESLIIPSVKPEDSGKYLCFLWANVGSLNQEMDINLNVSECLTSSPTLPITSSEKEFTQSKMSEGSLVPMSKAAHLIKELPLAFLLLGMLCLSFSKILLSVFAIWVYVILPKLACRR